MKTSAVVFGVTKINYLSMVILPKEMLDVLCNQVGNTSAYTSIGFKIKSALSEYKLMEMSHVDRQYAESGFTLQELCTPCPASVSVQPAFQRLSQPSYTGLFEHPLPTTKPTQPLPLPISHKDSMLLQPTVRRWGAERELIYVKRGYSLTVAIFI